MAINYPSSLDTFGGDKTDSVDDVDAVDINDLQDAAIQLETYVGTSSPASGSLRELVNNFLVSPRTLWLYEDTAPTNWTYQSSITDTVLAVKGGSNAYNVSGGNPDSAATWTMDDGYALVANDLPEHTHSYNVSTVGGVSGSFAQGAGGSPMPSAVNSTTEDEHSHWDATYRSPGSVGILVKKDA